MGILTDGDPLSKFPFFTIFRIFTHHRKGIKGTPNPKLKGGKLSGEGGLPPTDPPTGHRGDHLLRTHPPGDPRCVPLLTFLSSSASRFHLIGNKRSKSNRNGLLFPTHYNVSIAVTNRIVLWNICRINM